MLSDFKEDISRYISTQNRHWLYLPISQQGLWALAEYRFGRCILTRVKNRIFRIPLLCLCFLLHKAVEILTGIDLPHRAQIGKGLYTAHFGEIFLCEDVVLGSYCNISQGVTIGFGISGDLSGSPKVGDRVFFGPGAKAFGPIHIGNDALVGSNTVVTKNVPDSAVVVGGAPRIISYKSSKKYVKVFLERERAE